jgi:type I restriction enzyme, S subunit
MTWQTQTLGEICDEGGGEVRTGPFGSQLHESDYSELGTPVVMPKDIIEGRVSERTVARIADEHVHRLARHQLRTGDIVYGRRGDIGRQALITPRESGWLCGTGCLRITPGRAKVDSTYLHYYLRDASVIEGIAQQAIGATMPNLNTTILRGIQVRFPPADEQRRIASILSAYDDLIENNTRRIAILEAMARRIYEEWFIRFRFPGHEGVRTVESELGLVPEGWRTDVLAGVCEPKTGIQTGPFGSQLHKADYSEVGVPLLMPKDLIGFRIEEDSVARVPETTAESLKRHRMRPGDIAYGRRGDIGRRAFIMAHQAGWLCGTGCLGGVRNSVCEAVY